MAKSVLLDILEKTIGKYVLDLDATSLNVAIWSGNTPIR
jgi:vacuolar protein sorting-associated protein 13A/C